MESKLTGFLFVTTFVVGTLLLFVFFSENLGDTAIAGEAVRLGSGCVFESDDGLDFLEYGFVETSTNLYEDYCYSDILLAEYYCDARTNVIEVEYDCSGEDFVCSGGMCLSEEDAALLVEESITHTIEFVDSGFSVDTLTISVGDTVEFVNSRENLPAMLIGTQGNTDIRSESLDIGESYSYTFTEANRYVFVDAILFGYDLVIYVQE